jgi:hypothetical protein
MPTLARATKLSNLDDREARSALVFYRAADEGIRSPGDVVSLLKRKGIRTGILRARNPITHDQWWIPVVAAAGVPYFQALASVIRAWLKERSGRKVKLETARLKISAGTPAEVERLLAAIAKHEKPPDLLHVTKAALKAPAKKNARKRSDK